METPKEKLKKMTAWDTVPELEDAEIDEVLTQSSVADADGLAPVSEEWTPTYNLNAAAAAGWLIKAGRASGTTETDAASLYVTSKIFENCCRMARIYKAKGRASISFAKVQI